MKDHVVRTFSHMNMRINELYNENLELRKEKQYLEQQILELRAEIQVMKGFEKLNK